MRGIFTGTQIPLTSCTYVCEQIGGVGLTSSPLTPLQLVHACDIHTLTGPYLQALQVDPLKLVLDLHVCTKVSWGEEHAQVACTVETLR